jgi:hypothetical protein
MADTINSNVMVLEKREECGMPRAFLRAQRIDECLRIPIKRHVPPSTKGSGGNAMERNKLESVL